MELQLGLTLSLNSAHGSFPDINFEDCASLKRKRSYGSAFQTTLPLLSWKHNQPNEEEDDDNEKHSSTEEHEDEDGGLVGWPPIKSWRKKNQRLAAANGGGGAVTGGGEERRSSSYVKVKMDGVAIARKIDLSQYSSSATLLNTLLTMFGIDREEEYSNYVMTYQDKEGDWLLANDDDVPWRLFVESAQRLKLQRN
ncbi:auxin-responsive protein IAA29 [Impatiens glandulifera]|uniref:auxin-responsive protein IAA29 n=1 Tax=Impatiens glandulifera TaxID=253017 RepID=UPI001FB12C6C|nr:auxin-responsive protein IAA29 [Impatiens glandulifera]